MWIFSQTSNTVGRSVSHTMTAAQSTLPLSGAGSRERAEQLVRWIRGIFPFGNFQLVFYPRVYRTWAHCKLLSIYILIACSYGPTEMTTSLMWPFNFDITWGQNDYVLSVFGSAMCCWVATSVRMVYPCLSFFFLRCHEVFKAVMRTNERPESLVWSSFSACFKMSISFSYIIPFKSSFLHSASHTSQKDT